MKALKQIASNQVVICEGNYGEYKYEFYSYGTLIATYEVAINEGKTSKLALTEYYDYSRTTSKYLKIFLSEYCGILYGDKKDLNKMIKEGGIGDINISLI